MKPELKTYIESQRSAGFDNETISKTLISAGWHQNDIQEAFMGTQALTPPSTFSSKLITEKDYPVEMRWVIKSIIGMIVAMIILFFVSLDYFFIYVILTPFYLTLTILRRRSFHYSMDESFLVVKQGVISKQQRNIPYGVIQNILVKQDVMDRLLGLAALNIENASSGGGTANVRVKDKHEMVGFKGNLISIPGLAKNNAETLKEIILKKVSDNPIEDSQSGL